MNSTQTLIFAKACPSTESLMALRLSLALQSERKFITASTFRKIHEAQVLDRHLIVGKSCWDVNLYYLSKTCFLHATVISSLCGSMHSLVLPWDPPHNFSTVCRQYS